MAHGMCCYLYMMGCFYASVTPPFLGVFSLVSKVCLWVGKVWVSWLVEVCAWLNFSSLIFWSEVNGVLNLILLLVKSSGFDPLYLSIQRSVASCLVRF